MTLQSLLAHYGAALVGVLVFFANVGVPVPGHFAYVTSVILAADGRISLPAVVLASAPAAFLGSWAGFVIGQRGGHKLLVDLGPRFGLTAPRVATMERFFVRFGGAAILLMRFVVVIRTFGSVFAGMNEYPLPRFLLFSALGAAAWAAAYALGASLLRGSWNAIEDTLGVCGLAVVGGLLLLGVAHVIWRRRRKS